MENKYIFNILQSQIKCHEKAIFWKKYDLHLFMKRNWVFVYDRNLFKKNNVKKCFVHRIPKVNLVGVVLRGENKLSACKTAPTRLTFGIQWTE